MQTKIEKYNNRLCNGRQTKDGSDYYYYTTKDLISDHVPYWLYYASDYANKAINMLEIGSFQGQSATWWIDNILTHENSTLTCIDPFFKRKLVPDYDIFCDNIAKTNQKHKVTIMQGLSGNILPTLLNNEMKFDIIYVDGSHEYMEVYEDCVFSWELLKEGGLLILDDYRMSPRFADDKIGCKPAIDDFIELLRETEQSFDLLDTNFINRNVNSKQTIGYQVQIRKL